MKAAMRPWLFLLAGLFLAAGCGPKPETRQSVLDTPEYHVSQALNLLNRGDLAGARAAVERALALDPKYAEGHSVLGLVLAEGGEYKEGRDEANRGIELDRKNPWTWAVRGRIKTLQKKNDKWLESAQKDFSRATGMDPSLSVAYLWWGMARRDAFDFAGAGEMFRRVIDFQDEWSAAANREYRKVQMIERAAPGTLVGRKIALLPEITRADLAALFFEELKLAEVLKQARPIMADTSFVPPGAPGAGEVDRGKSPATPVDIEGHWARTWILDALRFGVMEVSPDNRFYPDLPVSRAEYALFLTNILVDIFHDESLATRYIGEPSRFKDMRSNTATYNAAALCVDRGLMQPRLDGTFGPTENVSGPEALLIIHSLRDQLRMVF